MSLQPDAITSSACIDACGLASRWELALTFLQGDLVGYSACVSACEKASAWRTALALFAEAQATLQVDAVLIAAAVAAFEKAEQWAKALASLAKAPSAAARTSALRALGRCRQWQRALELLWAGAAWPCSSTVLAFSIVFLHFSWVLILSYGL